MNISVSNNINLDEILELSINLKILKVIYFN
jgi:hypothetical protein